MKKKIAKKQVWQRWVIKVGSRLVSDGGPKLVRDLMSQVVRLRQYGIEVIWVTSGAIATAKEHIRLHSYGFSFTENQALSAIGQPILIHSYIQALQRGGLNGAQLLITRHDMQNSAQRKKMIQLVELLLHWKIIPIFNENDVAVRQNNQFRDNDSLAADLAVFVGAHRLILCTDVEGLYDRDPNQNGKARPIPLLKGINSSILSVAKTKKGSAMGRGGMYSKLLAGRDASLKGVETWLVKGDHANVLLQVAMGKSVGTRILAKKTNPKGPTK